MKKIEIIISVLLATFGLVALTGCGSLQNKISKSHEVIAANLAQTASGATKAAQTPPLTLNVTGSSNNVPLTITPQPMEHSFTTGAASAIDGTEDDFSKRRLPFTVALVAGAIGLLLAAFALWIWRKQSATVNVAYQGVDNFIASYLAHQGTSADASTALTAVRAELNRLHP